MVPKVVIGPKNGFFEPTGGCASSSPVQANFTVAFDFGDRAVWKRPVSLTAPLPLKRYQYFLLALRPRKVIWTVRSVALVAVTCEDNTPLVKWLLVATCTVYLPGLF